MVAIDFGAKHNILRCLVDEGCKVTVVPADTDAQTIIDLNPDGVFLSNGPGDPSETGKYAIKTIQALIEKEYPIFGICLGMQSIGAAFGGDIVRAPEVMHGKTSDVHHNGTGVFEGLPSPFTATRYHSLVVDPATLPDCLELTAWTVDDAGELDVIMGLRHRELSVEGVQFHPESILTEHGHAMLQNFLKQAS